MPKRSARKKSNKLKKWFKIFSLFIISGLFLTGYLFYKKVSREYASAFSVSSQDLLSNQIYASALIVADDFDAEPVKVTKLSLYIFDKSTLKTIVYNIPVDTVVNVPGRFSEEPFSNILALGSMDEGGLEHGAEIITRSIFKLMAFPVDRYMLVEEGIDAMAQDFYRGKINVDFKSDVRVLKDMVRTDHSLGELIDIYKFANSLPEDRVLENELGDTYIANPTILDEELMDITFDSILSREKKSVAVLNGSGQSGVAGFGSRVIRNLGGRVVATSNTNKDYENSFIVVDDIASESTRIIAQIFGIENIVMYSDLRGFDENEVSRSDITIIFGLDFAGSL